MSEARAIKLHQACRTEARLAHNRTVDRGFNPTGDFRATSNLWHVSTPNVLGVIRLQYGPYTGMRQPAARQPGSPLTTTNFSYRVVGASDSSSYTVHGRRRRGLRVGDQGHFRATWTQRLQRTRAPCTHTGTPGREEHPHTDALTHTHIRTLAIMVVGRCRDPGHRRVAARVAAKCACH